MNLSNPRNILILGFILVLLGAVLPALMVFRVIDPTFFLSFVSFGSSVMGLFLGLVGTAYYVRLKATRKRD